MTNSSGDFQYFRNFRYCSPVAIDKESMYDRQDDDMLSDDAGSYRALYVCNWLYRYQREQYLEPITFTSGCFQTMIYLYFFIRIYPLLHTENQCEPIKVVQDIVHVDDIKIDLSQNEKHVVP
jgi:hypothetical protein